MKPETVKVQNIFGVEYVEINNIKDGLTVIGGKNGQGKTSFIKAILMAVQKKAVKSERKVKDGSDKGIIEIITDEGIIITHTFSASGDSSLKITKNENSITKPQDFLNSIVKEFTVDPIKFINMKQDEQINILLNLSGFDVDQCNANIKYLYDDRQSINRDLKKAETVAKDLSKYKETKQIDVSELTTKIIKAKTDNLEISNLKEEKKRIESEVEQLKNRLSELEKRALEIDDILDFSSETDTADMEKQLSEAKQINEDYAMYQKRIEAEKEYKKLFAESSKLTDGIEKLRDEKKQSINELKIMEGLSLSDNDNLMLNGIQLDDCSTSEQIKFAMKVAMLSQPEFKLLIIDRAESLDEDNLKLVNDIATENGYVIFATKVGEAEIMIKEGKNA